MTSEPDWDEIRARNQQLDAVARAEVDSFVGLSETDGHARAGELGLTLRTAPPDQPVTADYRFGRITATVQDGTITGAAVG